MAGGGSCKGVKKEVEELLDKGEKCLLKTVLLRSGDSDPYRIVPRTNCRDNLRSYRKEKFPEIYKVVSKESKVKKYKEYEKQLEEMEDALTERNGEDKFKMKCIESNKRNS